MSVKKLVMACRFHGISPDEVDCPTCPTPDDCDVSPTWIEVEEDE